MFNLLVNIRHLLTCSDDHGLAIVALLALALKHLGPLEHNVLYHTLTALDCTDLLYLEHDVLSLVVVVEFDGLVRDGDLGDGDGLPSQHGLIDNAGSLHKHSVALHRVAPRGRKQDKVTGNQIQRTQLHF